MVVMVVEVVISTSELIATIGPCCICAMIGILLLLPVWAVVGNVLLVQMVKIE